MHFLYLGFALAILLMLSSAMAPALAEGTKGFIAREDIVWTTGYHVAPPANNPEWHWGYGFGAYYMYDPLFCWNNSDQSNPQMLRFIGDSISWDATGENLSLKIRTDLYWSDGKPITILDVNYSLQNTIHDTNMTTSAEGDGTGKIKAFTVVGDTNITITMKSTYHFSKQVYDTMTRRKVVLPLHVWPAALAENGNNEWYAWTNDWFSAGYKEEWKVVSGPYKPKYYSTTTNEEVYERNDNYWGFNTTCTTAAEQAYLGAGTIAANAALHPKYIGHLHYPDNAAAQTALAEDAIDWSSKFVSRVWDLNTKDENITVYVQDSDNKPELPFYTAESSVVELVFNMQAYPFAEKWFRQSVAWAINYQGVADNAMQGYARKAYPGRIDKISARHAPWHNETAYMEAGTGVSGDGLNYDFNLATAYSIFTDFAYYNTTAATWVVKNVTEELLPLAAGRPDLDSTTVGLQCAVQNHTWQIRVPDWSDSIAAADAFSIAVQQIVPTSSGFPRLKSITNVVDYGVWDSGFAAGGFDMAYHTGSAKTCYPVVEAYYWMLGAASAWGGNPFNWKYGNSNKTQNPDYDSYFQDLVDEFDVVDTTDPIAMAEISYEIQQFMADEIPAIPVVYNCNWNTNYLKYWTGWPSTQEAILQSVPVWLTGYPGSMIITVMNLRATGTKGPIVAPTGTPIPIVPVVLGIALLGAALLVYRKRR